MKITQSIIYNGFSLDVSGLYFANTKHISLDEDGRASFQGNSSSFEALSITYKGIEIMEKLEGNILEIEELTIQYYEET